MIILCTMNQKQFRGYKEETATTTQYLVFYEVRLTSAVPWLDTYALYRPDSRHIYQSTYESTC